MGSERRKQMLLVALVVILAAAMVYGLIAPGAPPPPAEAGAPARSRTAAGGRQEMAPEVHLDALTAERPKPDEVDRNLFRFKPKPAPPAPVVPRLPPPPAPRAGLVPGGPGSSSGTPPIALKFVGFLATEQGERIASLNDGRGVVVGKEGQIVLGRYKIWRIGDESIDVSYVDGTGRTTIRLAGQ